MKSIIFLLVLAFFTPFVFAQNTAPTLSNLTVVHDPAQQTVSFNFDVTDPENDPLDLQLRVSADSGLTWLVSLNSVTGDVGYPQMSGTNKTIVWTYDPADLATAYPTGPIAFEGRIIADDREEIDLQEIVDMVDSARVVDRLRTIEGARNWQSNPTHLAESRDTIAAWMAQMGLQNWHYNWQQSVFNGRNMSGRHGGVLEEANTWMVSGHYDSESVPGADDNGTGTVGVLEAGEVLSGYLFHNSIRFLNFDLEEEGLLGSRHYAQNKVQAWENLEGLLNLEMIGYKDESPNSQSLPAGFNILFPAAYQEVQSDSFRGNFLTNVANVNSNQLKESFDSCAASYVPDLRVISLAVSGNGQIAPDLRRSDHAPFWDAGYQALMLTDGANLRNPNYHQPGDSLGTLDLKFLIQNVKAVVATLAKVAQPIHGDLAVASPFTINVPVGLEAKLEEKVSLYPNPSSGTVHIEFGQWKRGEVSVEIHNSTGQLVFEGLVPVQDGGLTWEAQEMSAGLYWLSLDWEGQKVVRQIRLME